MAEILLARHAESLANRRNFTAFGNVNSPLTPKGVEQAHGMTEVFRSEFGIDPATYKKPVAVSRFTRPQQTALIAGFTDLDFLSLINESEVDRDIMSGVDVINRHKAERWVPDETKKRAGKFLDAVASGELDYDIYFTHGMFIAGVLLECDVRLIEVVVPFTEKRGYVPLQASITKVEI